MAIFCCLNQSAIHTGIPPVLLEQPAVLLKAGVYLLLHTETGRTSFSAKGSVFSVKSLYSVMLRTVTYRNVFLLDLVVVCYQVQFAENCFIVAWIKIFCTSGSESLEYGFCYIFSVFVHDLIGCILNADEQIFVRTEHVLYLQILSAQSAGPNVSRRFQMKSLFESIYN